MGQNVEQLLGEKGNLTQERERLAAEQKNLAKEIVCTKIFSLSFFTSCR